jgi:crotonobetainyl-CoA:carnitine CoA-transferase CaiB-like acyl-CoA transferase
MCEALDKPEWLTDERFSTASTRVRNAAVRLEMTAEVLKTNSSDYWLERLDGRGVPCAPVLTRPQVIEQEQVKVNGQLFEYDHPGLGRVRQPRSAAQFDRTPTNTEPLAPRLGEHGREILAEYGYPEEKVAALVSDGVLKLPPD